LSPLPLSITDTRCWTLAPQRVKEEREVETAPKVLRHQTLGLAQENDKTQTEGSLDQYCVG